MYNGPTPLRRRCRYDDHSAASDEQIVTLADTKPHAARLGEAWPSPGGPAAGRPTCQYAPCGFARLVCAIAP